MRRQALTWVTTMTAVLVLALTTMAGAAPAPKDVVKQKLSFRYVANPNANPPDVVEIQDNAAIAAGTETGAFWSNDAMEPLQELVRALLRDDTELQRYVAAVLGITNRPVLVVMLDDSAPLTATMAAPGGGTDTVAFIRWAACLDTGNRAWPCARRLPDSAAFGGSMTLGPYVFQGVPPAAVRSVFLHELVHTQDRSDWREHIFTAAGRSYSYGADGDHQHEEVIPNTAMTYAEGIADAIQFLYQPDLATLGFSWWATNGIIWVDKPPAGGPPIASWLYDTIKKVQPPVPEIQPITVPPAPSATDPNRAEKLARRQQIMDWNKAYAYYEVRSLPPNLIMQNEHVLALVLSEWERNMSFDGLMAALKTTNGRVTDVCASATATLIEELAKSSGTGTQRLVPLAYIDYFTAYKAKDEAEFAAIFDGLLSKERWITPYFAVRDKVKAAAPQTAAKPPEFGDLTSIAMALGVTSQTR